VGVVEESKIDRSMVKLANEEIPFCSISLYEIS